MSIDYFRTLARYNRWANKRLYEACAALPEAEYGKKRQAFFGSIHATLNHILVGDRVWLGRITGEGSSVKSLDQILYDDFAALRAAREAEDERIIAVLDALPQARLDEDLAYNSMAGEAQRTPLRLVLGHLFNHATHHRGQVHDMLTQTPVAPPPLDLIYFLREI